MTKKQREKCRALVADAKSKSEWGDWVYKVRGPPGHWKIIQIRKRNLILWSFSTEMLRINLIKIIYKIP